MQRRCCDNVGIGDRDKTNAGGNVCSGGSHRRCCGDNGNVEFGGNSCHSGRSRSRGGGGSGSRVVAIVVFGITAAA